MRDPIRIISDISKYGDISHFRFGNQHIYLLNHPDYIRDVLVTYNSNFVKSRGLQLARKVLGEGLLTSEGSTHDYQRQLIQPAFHQRLLPAYVSIMKQYIENMIGRWEDNTILDIHKEFTKLTLAIVCKIFFNYEIELDSEEVSNHVTTVIEYFNRVRMPLARLIELLPLSSNKRFRSAKRQLDKIICHIIDGHEPAAVDSTTELGHGDNSRAGDLVSVLLASRKADLVSGKVFTSDLRLKDNIITIFLAGHETVANALTWTFYLLSQSKEIEGKLHNEVDSVLGDDGLTNDVNMSKLLFTEKVFAESMRLYPPAWAVGRQAINDCRIGGYLIPAGSTILMSQYLTHRDPRFFTEPHRFNPERWNNEIKAKLPRFSYFPFGGGPRSCIGEQFAWMEGILAISTVSRRWRMDLEPSRLVVPQPLLTLRPKYGILMRLIRRT